MFGHGIAVARPGDDIRFAQSHARHIGAAHGRVERQRAGDGQAHHIELDHAHGAIQGKDGALHVMRGAHQPHLLSIPGGKQHGALGRVAGGLPTARDLEQHSHAGGVVVGPKVNAAIGVLSQVVIVRAQNEHLVAQRGVGAGQHAEHVTADGRARLVHLHDHIHLRGELQRTVEEGQVVQRIAAALQQRRGHVGRNPQRGQALRQIGRLLIGAPYGDVLFVLGEQQ